MNTRQLFAQLVKIGADINKRIPLATNRYEQYETCPASFDLAAQDEVDAKYRVYEEYVLNARFEFHVYEHLNIFFNEYLQQNNTTAANLSDENLRKLKALLLQESNRILQKMQRTQQVLHKTCGANVDRVNHYLITNADDFLFRLRKGEFLELRDRDLQGRFVKDKILVEYRELAAKQSYVNNVSALSHDTDADYQKKIRKLRFLYIGAYFDRIRSNVGYCDEHACIGLKRILEQSILEAGMRIEKVGISYEEGDGHTFLAINRDPDSKLNDITSWGKDAILFDPWNKLVCMAADFASQPLYYFSFPDGAKWEVEATYVNKDRHLLNTLSELDVGFEVAGYADIDKRKQEIINEYYLVSLEEPELASCATLLRPLIQFAMPENFQQEVVGYIAKSGSEPVSVIDGLRRPALAVHKDFLLDLAKGNVTIPQLIYGLAYHLEYIRQYPLGADHTVTQLQSHEMDAQVLDKVGDGDSAIAYLRYCMNFENGHPEENEFKFINKYLRDSCVGKHDHYLNRIKNLTTVIAKTGRKSSVHGAIIPETLASELNKLQKYQFFIHGFSQCTSKIEMLAYLETQLPVLNDDLLPYELNGKAGVRLREYCDLLLQINIDFSDQMQVAAVDRLIDKAIELRVAGIDRVYRAVLGMRPDGRDPFCYATSFAKKLQPLGMFKQFAALMTHFVSADNYETALTDAQNFLQLDIQLANHHEVYCTSYEAGKYVRRYADEHDNKLPQRRDRYFGSTIAYHIKWQSFNEKSDNEKQLPWDGHVAWAAMDKSGVIAKTLWRLGVTRDVRLWACFDQEYLRKLIIKDSSGVHLFPLIKLSGALQQYSDDRYMFFTAFEILNSMSEKHIVKSVMFNNPVIDFEEAFKNFYDQNINGLISPLDKRNTNNDTVKCLLTQFTRIAGHGDAKQRETVKSFFLGREDKRDLRHLMNLTYSNGSLTYNMPYVKFFMEQQYEGIKFDLFSVQEVLQLLGSRGICFSRDTIPPEAFIRVFALPDKSLDLRCMETLIPLMKDCHFDYEIPKIIPHHLLSNRYTLPGKNTARLARLALYTHDRQAVLQSIQWALPESSAGLVHMDPKDVITIYRIFDETMEFPSEEKQEKLTVLMLDYIDNVSCSYLSGKRQAERLQVVLEHLLFTKDTHFSIPISDFSVRNHAVAQWVACIFQQYGLDDGSDEYFNALVAIIDKLFTHVAGRDLNYILEKLTDRILAQQRVSDYIGMQMEPEKYLQIKQNNPAQKYSQALTALSQISILLSKDRQDQLALLNFVSKPITKDSTHTFALHVIAKGKTSKIAKYLGFNATIESVEFAEKISRITYHMFWERPLEERAVVINYLLIPSDQMATKEQAEAAYREAFAYVAKSLFPRADDPASDDNFAVAFLGSYLAAADEYVRGFFLAGMLVASNQSHGGAPISTGKKLAMLCEHLGPAYVKLAQAIHSHPKTPESIRRDLDHVKGRARPLSRWHLWRMIEEALPKNDRSLIAYLGPLLGSASYNLAIKVRLQNGRHVVLSLLRENAEKDAKNGFEHLHKAILGCKHPRLDSLRSTAAALVHEAEILSEAEMNYEKSRQQFAIAQTIYQQQITIDEFSINIKPTNLIKGGYGYRYIDLMHGTEFNDLPDITAQQTRARNIIARAILQVELRNILRGGMFDCDRHGNQLRVQVDFENKNIQIGLYDFGEMALAPPTKADLTMLAGVVKALPSLASKKSSMSQAFDALLSDHIERWNKKGYQTSYLMRLRKGLLALQDFQKHLSPQEFMDVLMVATKNEQDIHPLLRDGVSYCRRLIKAASVITAATKIVKNRFELFAGGKKKEVSNSDAPKLRTM